MGISTKSLITAGVCILYAISAYANDGYPDYRSNNMLQNQFATYMSELHTKIDKNWTPPDTMENAHVTVMFKVNRYGEISGTEIVTSSGNPIYDESATDALRKATPFPKFPASTTRDSITVKYNFDTSLVKTDTMKAYVDAADRFYGINNQEALRNINLAINEVRGDIGAYFLYGKRSKIKRAMGDIVGAEEDFSECRQLKAKFDKKRIMNCKLIAEMEQSPFAFFYLANAYDIAGEYENAIKAIDKAISLTELNNNYKRYRIELVNKAGGKS